MRADLAVASKSINLDKYIIFAPLFAGMRNYDHAAMLFGNLLVWRRVILVVSSLFLADYAWIQALLYLASSLANLVFLGAVMPFDTPT